MAGAAFFDIVIRGLGSHAAMPHQSRDPIVIASGLVSQIQSIISRNVPPLETCVLSVTQIHAGSAYNVVPEMATPTHQAIYQRPQCAGNRLVVCVVYLTGCSLVRGRGGHVFRHRGGQTPLRRLGPQHL